MMDVERIQKINALALDLLKQGLASDREDAVIQAEKVYRDRDAGEYRDIRQTMSEIRAETKKETAKDISQAEIKEILEKNTTFLVNKLKEFQEKIAALENEIDYLKRKIVFQGPTTKEMVSNMEESSKPQPTKEQAPSKHPRSGDYKEEDVSIEKFFYMGSR